MLFEVKVFERFLALAHAKVADIFWHFLGLYSAWVEKLLESGLGSNLRSGHIAPLGGCTTPGVVFWF